MPHLQKSALLALFAASVSTLTITEYCLENRNCLSSTLEPMTDADFTPTLYLTSPTTTTITEYPLTLVRYEIPTYAPGFYTLDVPQDEEYQVQRILTADSYCNSEIGRTRALLTTHITAYVPPQATGRVKPYSSDISTDWDDNVKTTYYLTEGAAPLASPFRGDGLGETYIFCEDFGWTDGKPDEGDERWGIDTSFMDDMIKAEEDRAKSLWFMFAMVAVGYMVLMLFFGFIQSFMNFSAMMRGHSHRASGIPYCWVLMIGLLPGLIYYCLVRGNKTKVMPLVIKAEMEKEYAAMSMGKKLGLWLKYGIWNNRPPCLEAVELRVTEEVQRAEMSRSKETLQSEDSAAAILNAPALVHVAGDREPKENFSRAV